MSFPTGPTVAVKQRRFCSACGAMQLEEILDLPKLPLTGIFIKPEERSSYPSFDQALLRCGACGHAQLRETVDPSYLYQETYTHRSSLSPISTRGNDFFFEFLQSVSDRRNYKSIVEIGCNDLYLLKRLQGWGDALVGFDPIWKNHSAPSLEKVEVHGKYIEEIDPSKDISRPPELVLSVHTLEHVDNPLGSLRPIFDHAEVGALFVIEVPGFDTLIDISRFDQVFHQHLNYFSVASFQAMIAALGGEYIRHAFNYNYWLGTMLIAFRKPAHRPTADNALSTPPPSRELIARQWLLFKQELDCLSRNLARLNERKVPVFGYGAAQMVPTIAYHLGTDLAELRGILDDNPAKEGLTYPSIGTRIELASRISSLSGAAVLVTAADSARRILSRLDALQARYILFPFNPI